MINGHSPKRAKVEIEKKKAYDEIDEERGLVCEVCGARTKEHSHNFPRGAFPQWISKKENLSILCNKHHLAWEECRLWELNVAVLMRVIVFIGSLDRPDHASNAYAYFTNKLYKMKDRAIERKIVLPGFIRIILEEWDIPYYYEKENPES